LGEEPGANEFFERNLSEKVDSFESFPFPSRSHLVHSDLNGRAMPGIEIFIFLIFDFISFIVVGLWSSLVRSKILSTEKLKRGFQEQGKIIKQPTAMLEHTAREPHVSNLRCNSKCSGGVWKVVNGGEKETIRKRRRAVARAKKTDDDDLAWAASPCSVWSGQLRHIAFSWWAFPRSVLWQMAMKREQDISMTDGTAPHELAVVRAVQIPILLASSLAKIQKAQPLPSSNVGCGLATHPHWEKYSSPESC
jgi:hypothetical protein